MKKIPIFIKHFGIRNVDLYRLLRKKGHIVSAQSMIQNLNPLYKQNKFDKYELILLAEIEKEFLNKYREKLVKYKHLKFLENENRTR